MSDYLTHLKTELDKLACDRRIHSDAIAAIDARTEGIEFARLAFTAGQTAESAPISTISIRALTDKPPRKPRRTKAQIAADTLAAAQREGLVGNGASAHEHVNATDDDALDIPTELRRA